MSYLCATGREIWGAAPGTGGDFECGVHGALTVVAPTPHCSKRKPLSVDLLRIEVIHELPEHEIGSIAAGGGAAVSFDVVFMDRIPGFIIW